MNRLAARFYLLISPSLLASTVWAQAPASHVENAAARADAGTPGVTGVSQHLFGAIPLSTRSVQTRRLLELAVNNYENAIYRESAVQARRAAEADPQSALAHAMLSFAARRIMPDAGALEKAKTLLPRATPDEQLLVRWMTSIQDHDLLPAISSMNDLLKRYPRDKHILYMTAEWLYLQQDDDRARSMMEAALQSDPNFPAVLNRLGYVYIGTGTPDPAKAIASLKRYAEVEPGSPNPQDSLGEVSRMAGDDPASLEHLAARALSWAISATRERNMTVPSSLQTILSTNSMPSIRKLSSFSGKAIPPKAARLLPPSSERPPRRKNQTRNSKSLLAARCSLLILATNSPASMAYPLSWKNLLRA